MDRVSNFPVDQALAEEQVASNRTLLNALAAVIKHVDNSLSVGQLLILSAALDAQKRGRSFVVSDVERLCNMPKSTASRTVASLSDFVDEGLGLLSARTHPVDRRKKELRPTPKLLNLMRHVFDDAVSVSPRITRVACD